MPWAVLLHGEFEAELLTFEAKIRIAVLRYAKLLQEFGPELGRPYADTLKGSRHANMKELRPTVNKVEWRVAYAFDRERQAILLAAAAKGGSKVAMARLVARADERLEAHYASSGRES